MSSEVGSGQVAIFPVFKGFRSAVTKETDGAAKAASSGFNRLFGKTGNTAGQAAGRGFKSAFDSSSSGTGAAALKRLQAEVASASKAVSASRLKEQDSTGKLRVAEAQLTEARSKHTAGSARLVAAEEKVAAAQRSVTAAQNVTKDASTRLSAAQTRVAATADSAGAASSRSAGRFRVTGSALRGLQGAAGGVARVFGTGIGLGVGLAAVNALGRGVRRLTGYIAESVSTAAEWQTLNAQSAAVVKSTGGVAQVTAKHVGALSQSLENATATEAEAIQNGANLLLTFTGIRNEAGKGNKIFDRTTAVAVDMAKALKIDVSAAAMQLGKALNDPAKGLTKLSRSGVTFTDQQKEQVKALVASGKTLEAQKIILGELNKEFGGSGAAYANTYAGSLYRIKDAAGDFGASILSGALPSITKLLNTGADLINWAGGTNVVQQAAGKLAEKTGLLAGKVLAFAQGLKGKNPLQDLFKVALPNIDFGKVTTGIQSAIGVAKPLLGAFFSYLRNIGPGIGAALTVIGPALADVFTQLGPALQESLPLLGQAFVTLLPSAVKILQALLPLLPPVAQTLKSLAPIVSVLADALSFLITNGLQPLVQQSANFGRVFTAFTSGVAPAKIAVDALSGRFGPLLQVAARVGFVFGTVIRTSLGLFRGFASGVSGLMGAVVGVISGRISAAVGIFQRLAAVPGIAGRAIGGFVSTIVGGLGRAVSGAAAGVGRVLALIGGIPGRVRGVIGNLGSLLFSAGSSIVDGLARGIRSAIGRATGAAGDLMGAVARLLPHSPAKEGPLSGKGWTLYSGRAIATSLAAGMSERRSTGTVRAAAARMTSAVSFATSLPNRLASTAATAASSTTASGTRDRPIYADGIGLMGWVRDLANGQAQLVWNTQNTALSTSARLGQQEPVFT